MQGAAQRGAAGPGVARQLTGMRLVNAYNFSKQKTRQGKMKTFKVTWTGIRPMVMHNGLLADCTNPYTKQIKAITAKGSKKITDFDREEMSRLEWEGGLYWSDTLGIVVPSDNIERCIQLGAQKSRVGKDVQAAVFCDEAEYKLIYDGPKDKAKMYADKRFTLRKGVCIQNSRVIRVRPMVPTGWSVTFGLEYDETVISKPAIEKAMVDAGALIGLGDWRPKFGRFTVEVN